VIDHFTTEQRNPASEKVDQLSTIEVVELMNREDRGVAEAVGKQAANIASAVDAIVEAIKREGRLIYLGAGTSGRLGVLDASECPPTFNTPPELVVGLIAGGHSALVRSIEGAEDFPEYGHRDLKEIVLTANDVVVGIATSGRTPYVIGGLEYARSLGCCTIGLACNVESKLAEVSDIMICPVVGPEIVSGSTRMKAGTATKLVLNSLTTATMIRLGKTYGNLMVDLRATNSKLRDRSRRIVRMLAAVDNENAQRLLDACDGEVKTAIVSHQRAVDAEEARRILRAVDGHLRAAIENP
jgi:N-acetylmuramic acid 6-phosphate etherase